jgi:hypothetical protein
MTRTELIIQLLKVAIALAFGAYFVWWSLQVLDRLTPDYDAATTMVGPIFQVQRVARRGVACQWGQDAGFRTHLGWRTDGAIAAFAVGSPTAFTRAAS